MSLKTSISNYKIAKRLFKQIDDALNDVQSEIIEESEQFNNQMLRKSLKLQGIVNNIHVEDFKGNFSEKAVASAEQNVKVFEESAFYWEKLFFGAKYYDDLIASLSFKYIEELRLNTGEMKRYGADDIDSYAKKFAAAITHPDIIKNYPGQIKRLANATMTSHEFKRIHDFIQSKIIISIPAAKKYQKIKEHLMTLKNKFILPRLEEDFNNPFEDNDLIKKNAPTHIKDTNGSLIIRREVFNASRIEVSKIGTKYSIKSRGQFARGENVEICPALIVGSEVNAVDKLKDIVFEIDADKDEWAVVLGYGSLYKHSEEPNLEYAYNKLTKQMQFIAKRPIKLGEELTINYGTDYWTARQDFGTIATAEKSSEVIIKPLLVGKTEDEESDGEKLKAELEESEIDKNNVDADERIRKNSFASDPQLNPAVTGRVILGGGQS